MIFISNNIFYALEKGDVPLLQSIPMHREGCMPQAAALRMNLRVPVRNE